MDRQYKLVLRTQVVIMREELLVKARRACVLKYDTCL